MRPVQWSREGFEHGGDGRVREDVEGLEAHLEWRQRGRVFVRGGALRRANRRRRRFLRRIESPPRRSRRRFVLVRSENPPLDVVHVHAKRDAVRRVHLRANVPKLDAKRLGGGRRARRLGAEDEGQSPRLERKRRRGAVRAAPRDAGRDVTRRTRGDGRGGRRRRLGETHRAEGEVASAAIERARARPKYDVRAAPFSSSDGSSPNSISSSASTKSSSSSSSSRTERSARSRAAKSASSSSSFSSEYNSNPVPSNSEGSSQS